MAGLPHKGITEPKDKRTEKRQSFSLKWSGKEGRLFACMHVQALSMEREAGLG